MTHDARALTAALVASLGAFLFGLDIGYIAPILECASFKRDVAKLDNWADPHSAIASGTVGFMVGIFSIGCIMTALPVVSSYFLDRWGRRSSIMIGSCVFLVGCALQARAFSVAAMFIGRFVTGSSIGLLSSVVPLYQAELSPPSIRGALTSTYQLMITAGIFVAAFVDTLLVSKDGGWRWAIWLQALPALAILLLMPFLPRSPRWLVQQGRHKEAQDTLQLLRGEQAGAQEYKEIVADYEASLELGEPRWLEVFSGRIGKIVALGSAMQLLQQLVGMNAFMYFGPRIFMSFGLKPNTFQTINNAVNFLATLPALYMVDIYGRRVLFIFGALGMGISCGVMGIIGTLCMSKVGDNWVPDNGLVAGILVACVFSFVISFACTWGPVVWVYCCEIFPLKYRARAVGVTTVSNWVGNYVIAQFSPMLLGGIGFNTFFVFGFFCVAAMALALWLPETKGLRLENIGEVFDEKFGCAPNTLPVSKDDAAYGATNTRGKVV